MAITLGLDLGPNSIGWALLDDEKKTLIDCGVRIFPEGVDNFDTKKEKPRNESRRIARGMRRQIFRRAQRKRRLRLALIEAGLYPSDASEQEILERQDPYELRARACVRKEVLTPHEIGRVFLHLNQRRGFLSNRKKERKSSEVKGMLAEISRLATDMGDRTLGQHLRHLLKEFDHVNRRPDDHVRGWHTLRQMLLQEFDAIWQAQAIHHPNLLTNKLRHGEAGEQKQPVKPRSRKDGQSLLEAFGIQGLIFFQRPIYWPRSAVGMCELEPRERRCPRADRRAQRFRMLQEVNNLRYIDPNDNQEKRLTAQQRAMLLDGLGRAQELDFDKIRKLLGFLETVRFNLESGKRTKIQGMVSDYLMSRPKALGATWHKLPETTKNGVVALLAQSIDDDETCQILIDRFGMTRQQADAALDVDLPERHVNLSVKAIEKLLPHLDRGLVLMGKDESDSAMHAAGYMRRDQLQQRVFDTLPDPARVRTGEARLGNIPSPVVKRAIVELRKVVNAILRQYGKPSAVHVEMARTVRMGPKTRKEYNIRIHEIEARRDKAADEIRKLREKGVGVRLSRDSILQYLLWEEQAHACIYCGNKISQAQLYGGEADIDHILPYSRTLDDSQMNKVVCHRKCNADKGNRMPSEWLAGDPTRYERVCQFALSLVRQGTMPYKKYRRILQKEVALDDFIARQLTATGYITRATAEYLRCLFSQDHDVLGLKGDLTAELRRQWGLNDVLREDGLDVKTREDHRHHVIDAIVVALTNRSRLQQLSKIRKAGGVITTGETLDFPWHGFRDDVMQKINAINISHRSQRKVGGALHEDTFYGRTEKPDTFVVRKSLEALSPNEVAMIRDAGIRRIIEKHLSNHGIEVGRGKKVDARKWREAMACVAMPSGVPIKRVRVLRVDQTIQPIREGKPDQVYVKPGSTHHLTLFEWQDNDKTRRGAVFVTMLDATNRIKAQHREFQRLLKGHEQATGRPLTKHDRRYQSLQKQAEQFAPLIQRTPPRDHMTIPPDAKFLFSLSSGETVMATVDGQERLLVYSTAAQTSGQMWFYAHSDARPASHPDKSDKSKIRKLFSFKPNTLNARKVVVDPLGRIRWAND